MAVRQRIPYRKVIQGLTPGAGAEFGFTAPGQGLWRVISLAFTFTTSAAVANRVPSIVVDDGTSVFLRIPTQQAQAATLAITYSAFTDAANANAAANPAILPLPEHGVTLEPGWRLRSSTALIDVLDQYSAISALVEEFPNGPGIEWTPSDGRDVYEIVP